MKLLARLECVYAEYKMTIGRGKYGRRTVKCLASQTFETSGVYVQGGDDRS